MLIVHLARGTDASGAWRLACAFACAWRGKSGAWRRRDFYIKQTHFLAQGFENLAED
ncbi:hypothetical protein A2U01_0086255 [Trifolium medium]|uniref:Uncharacterized protein n=1 Tax=Trifolium medium TaxID=97028 RepID=A0A392TX03_9FABA|nr:hypothetical protein [Trifolium medium]